MLSCTVLTVFMWGIYEHLNTFKNLKLRRKWTCQGWFTFRYLTSSPPDTWAADATLWQWWKKLCKCWSWKTKKGPTQNLVSCSKEEHFRDNMVPIILGPTWVYTVDTRWVDTLNNGFPPSTHLTSGPKCCNSTNSRRLRFIRITIKSY